VTATTDKLNILMEDNDTEETKKLLDPEIDRRASMKKGKISVKLESET